jgi:hypothetical protein
MFDYMLDPPSDRETQFINDWVFDLNANDLAYWIVVIGGDPADFADDIAARDWLFDYLVNEPEVKRDILGDRR